MDIAGLQQPLQWLREGGCEPVEGGVILTAGAGTDLFVDPRSAEVVASSPALTGAAPSPFQLRARVDVHLRETFDAAALLIVGAGDRTWGKLAVERAPDGRATIVTVVTRGVSDDCNHDVVDPSDCWLRVAGLGDEAYALHVSADARTWRLVRYFHLPGPVTAGLSVQSPMGSGCRARFTELGWESRAPEDIRDGT